MMNLDWWKRSLMVATLAVFAMLASRPWQVRSAEPAQDRKPMKYFGSETCSGCHKPDPAKPARFKNSKFFIKLDESVTWEQDDKHSDAYDNLTTERGRRMGELLHVEKVTNKEAGCLGCHSASVQELSNRINQASTFNVNEGVSCENCHGPYSGWSDEHLEPSFRTLPAAKWADMGFTEMRTAEGKAKKCLSCHIGNVAEGKVVTHEMYAAGHPPLPSIEVATFANAMPRHWLLNAERHPVEAAEIKKSLGYEEGQLEQTKLAIVGAAVALKTSLKLLADETRTAEKTGAPGQVWPDYARFDCWTCHHDLKRDGWRQDRDPRQGTPGRVPVSEWPLSMVELGIDRLVMANQADGVHLADLQGLEKALRDQANLRPFGRKAAIAEAADHYAKWLDVLIGKLEAAKYDKDVAAKLLRNLVERAEKSTPDYDEARHVAWTIKVLVDDLGVALPNLRKINEVVDKLDKGLKLTLPAGQFYKIEEQIGPALKVIGDYDPATFKAQLAELLPMLPPG
jgi:Cytochrome c554 and c-prime